MPHARSLPNRNAPEVGAGTHLDSDLDVLFAWDNAHEALTIAHGATGTVVGTTNSQTLSNKTLASPLINLASSLGLKYEAFAASATAADTSVICGVTDISADRTVTLSSAEIAKVGRIWFIKDETGACGNAFKIIVATAGAETIDGQNTLDIVANYGSLKIYSNGSNLFTIPD